MTTASGPELASSLRRAATVLLIRDGADGLEVFMVVRHREIEFASGALVFPGGSVEPDDFTIASALNRDLPADNGRVALRVAGIRETFEECGVLLARRRGSADLLDAGAVVDLAGKAKSTNFAALLASEGLEPATDLLAPFAHWITPTILPKRFDTHFFVAAAPPDQLAAHDGSEAVDSTWLNPAQALREADAGRYTMLLPTRLNLELLGRQNDTASALTEARRRPIVTVEPQATRREDGRGFTLRIPLEAGYGAEVYSI